MRLRPAAFLPYKGATSVFRIDGLDSDGVWDHVRRHAARPGRNLHGRGDFTLAEAEEDALRLDLDETPPRHGNIVGWPPGRDQQLAIARNLANIARAVRASGGSPPS